MNLAEPVTAVLLAYVLAFDTVWLAGSWLVQVCWLAARAAQRGCAPACLLLFRAGGRGDGGFSGSGHFPDTGTWRECVHVQQLYGTL